MKQRPLDQRLEARLDRLALDGLRRRRSLAPAPHFLSFCSNDYLGWASEPALSAPSGAGASRLVDGDTKEHRLLERDVATWLGTPDALLFSSGYAANVGVLSALTGPGDLVVSDALNHASIIDGARLARADIAVVPHLDIAAVRDALRHRGGRDAFVVTESYFSMDADTPDLSALRVACDEAGAAFIVDEAHALGVLGPDGRGLCAEVGVTPDVTVGTFGKAFGTGGAFVAGSIPLTDWLWNRARSFVFSTGLPPVVAAAASGSLQRIRHDSGPRARCLSNAARMRAGLADCGFAPAGHGHIIPCIVGDSERAVDIAAHFATRGIRVGAIRPPSVPRGTARLRFTASARHTPEELDRFLEAAAAAHQRLGS